MGGVQTLLGDRQALSQIAACIFVQSQNSAIGIDQDAATAKALGKVDGLPSAFHLGSALKHDIPRVVPLKPLIHTSRAHCEECHTSESGSSEPVAKFVSEPGNKRIGSAFRLGCPRMAVVKCGLARPIPRPFPNFATGPGIFC